MTERDNTHLQQQIADYFTRRSNTYDQSDYHNRLAARVLQFAQIEAGQRILDVACGTGLLSIPAAKLVGSMGFVLGLDISDGMLSQAQEKASESAISNLELHKQSAESANFPPNTFDRILCSSALTFFNDIPEILLRWFSFLKPGGMLIFDNPSKSAFIAGVILKECAEQFGVKLAFGNECGSEDRCRSVMRDAGFTEISIAVEQFGNYITLDEAARAWDAFHSHPLSSPIRHLSEEELNRLKELYLNKLPSLLTPHQRSDSGAAAEIWNDGTMFLVRGRKPY